MWQLDNGIILGADWIGAYVFLTSSVADRGELSSSEPGVEGIIPFSQDGEFDASVQKALRKQIQISIPIAYIGYRF